MSVVPIRPAYLDIQAGEVPPPKPETKPPLAGADLEVLEVDYRAGQLSLRGLAHKHGLSKTRVQQLAVKYGWSRDATRVARFRAKDILANRAKAARDLDLPDAAVFRQPGDPMPEAVRTVAEAVAENIAAITTKHRTAIERYHGLANLLLDELLAITKRPDLITEMVDALAPISAPGGDAGDDVIRAAQIERHRRLTEAVQRVTSTAGRTKTMKDLVDVLGKLVALEREAYDMAAEQDPAMKQTPPDRSMSAAEHYQWLAQQRTA